MNDEENMIFLDMSNEKIEQHVTKQEILSFFKDLKTIPLINQELIHTQILNNTFNLPKFNFETYFLDFCKYKDKKNQELIIIKDIGGDQYYYIQNEKVFQCYIFRAQQKFYRSIAIKKEDSFNNIYDEWTNKLSAYEAILLSSNSKYLSNLDDFIENNIYMFDEALKEKKLKQKIKLKP